MGTNVEEIVNEAERIEEDCLLTSKGHFTAASCWSKVHFAIGLSITLFAAAATTNFVRQNVTWASIFALVATLLSAINTFLNPEKRALNHLNAGNQFNTLRNNTRLFKKIKARKKSVAVLKELEGLNTDRNDLNQKSPQVPGWAYRRARKGVADGEAKHQVDS